MVHRKISGRKVANMRVVTCAMPDDLIEALNEATVRMGRRSCSDMIRVILRKYLIEMPEALAKARPILAKRGRKVLAARRARRRALRKTREREIKLRTLEKNREKMALKREIKRLDEVKAMEQKLEEAIVRTERESRLPPPDSTTAAWVTRLWKAKNG